VPFTGYAARVVVSRRRRTRDVSGFRRPGAVLRRGPRYRLAGAVAAIPVVRRPQSVFPVRRSRLLRFRDPRRRYRDQWRSIIDLGPGLRGSGRSSPIWKLDGCLSSHVRVTARDHMPAYLYDRGHCSRPPPTRRGDRGW